MRITIPADIAHIFDDDPLLGPHAQSGQPFELDQPLCAALLRVEQRVSAEDRPALEAFLYPLRDALLPTYAPVFTGPGIDTAQRRELNEWLQDEGPTEHAVAEANSQELPPERPAGQQAESASSGNESSLGWVLAGLVIGVVAFGVMRAWKK